MTTAGYGAPPATPRPRRRGGVVWPLILIFLGAVFLLQNAGVLPSNFWLNLWRLWPVILVLVGIELLFANRIPWLVLAAVGAAVLVIGVAVTNPGMTSPGSGPEAPRTTVATDLDSATQAAVTVRFGAGQLNVSSIDQPTGSQLATMTYQGPPPLAPTPRYSVAGGVGQLDYESTGHGGASVFPWFDGRGDSARADLALSPNVPLTSLTLQSGAAEAHLDLARLRISNLDMSLGAASASVLFPEVGVTTAHISGAASNITVQVPVGVAAQIRHRGGLSTVSVDQNRFPQVSEELYRSPDWDTAQNKLDLSIDTGVTSIQVS